MRILPAVLCVLLFAAPAWAQDCKLVQAASLPISTDGDIGVPVTLDGTSETLAFSFDNQFNEVSETYAAKRAFKTQRANYGNVYLSLGSSKKEMDLAIVHKLQIGPVNGPDVEFLVVPDRDLGGNGVLSQTALRDFDFELDIQGKKLNLFLQSHCPGQVVYWTASNIAHVPFVSTDMDGRFRMELDGQPVRVLLSPGSSTSLIGSKTLHRIFGIDLDSPGVERIAGSPDSAPLYHYAFKTLGVDTLTIRNPGITIYDQKEQECLDKPRLGVGSRIDQANGANCFGGHDLVLGMSVLRQLRFFFANKEMVLYVTPAGAH